MPDKGTSGKEGVLGRWLLSTELSESMELGFEFSRSHSLSGSIFWIDLPSLSA